MAELSNLLGQFSRQHRQLDVRIVVEQSHVLRQALVDRELDLALHQDFIPRIEARDQLLWTEQVHWCARPGWQPAPDECVRLIAFGPGCFLPATGPGTPERLGHSLAGGGGMWVGGGCGIGHRRRVGHRPAQQ
ncbi:MULTISPECIES: LysR substrate-binding domain-containing protein [unclassified Pseudomonas]|nr:MULTISPECIES: LysR substrate-binding domain-containing protein [unclassified Pseudomonas]